MFLLNSQKHGLTSMYDDVRRHATSHRNLLHRQAGRRKTHATQAAMLTAYIARQPFLEMSKILFFCELSFSYFPSLLKTKCIFHQSITYQFITIVFFPLIYKQVKQVLLGKWSRVICPNQLFAVQIEYWCCLLRSLAK